jgi:hypothetical protein
VREVFITSGSLLLAVRYFGGGDRGLEVHPLERVGRFHLSDLESNETRLGLSNLGELALTLSAFGVLNRRVLATWIFLRRS